MQQSLRMVGACVVLLTGYVVIVMSQVAAIDEFLDLPASGSRESGSRESRGTGSREGSNSEPSSRHSHESDPASMGSRERGSRGSRGSGSREGSNPDPLSIDSQDIDEVLDGLLDFTSRGSRDRGSRGSRGSGSTEGSNPNPQSIDSQDIDEVLDGVLDFASSRDRGSRGSRGSGSTEGSNPDPLSIDSQDIDAVLDGLLDPPSRDRGSRGSRGSGSREVSNPGPDSIRSEDRDSSSFGSAMSSESAALSSVMSDLVSEDVVEEERDCVHRLEFGFPLLERSIVDRTRYWINVDNRAFEHPGVITHIRLHAGEGDRTLRVGIYRPEANRECRYKLIHETTLRDIPRGFQRIQVPREDWLAFEAGDHLGFTWAQSGVVSYDGVEQMNYCTKQAQPRVGSVLQMDARYGNRVYSLQAEYELYASHLNIGPEIINRPHVDNEDFYTFVDENTFEEDGIVDAIELYSKRNGLDLRVGIYRPAGQECKFTLVRQVTLSADSNGHQIIRLQPSQSFRVSPGDHFGFTWLNRGMIAYTRERGSPRNYCTKHLLVNEGETVELDRANSDRLYSIRLHYHAEGCVQPVREDICEVTSGRHLACLSCDARSEEECLLQGSFQECPYHQGSCLQTTARFENNTIVRVQRKCVSLEMCHHLVADQGEVCEQRGPVRVCQRCTVGSGGRDHNCVVKDLTPVCNPGNGEAMRCWTCNAENDDFCFAFGQLQTCANNDDVCDYSVTKNNRGQVTNVQRGCKSRQQCTNSGILQGRRCVNTGNDVTCRECLLGTPTKTFSCTENLVTECLEPSNLLCTGTTLLADVSASSVWANDHGPQFSCLNTAHTNRNRGAWSSLHNNAQQWLQADFGGLASLKSIVTQGRHEYDKWVTSYKVLYSNDGVDWHTVKDVFGREEIFAGNEDRDSHVANQLPYGLLARYVRIQPLTWHRHVSMRWGVLGCLVSNCRTEPRSRIACEGRDEMSVACPAGQTIRVLDAYYGRSVPDSQVCSTNIRHNNNQNCASAGSRDVVVNSCNDQRQCHFPRVQNSVFGGDPCPNTYKYLNITYQCMYTDASNCPPLLELPPVSMIETVPLMRENELQRTCLCMANGRIQWYTECDHPSQIFVEHLDMCVWTPDLGTGCRTKQDLVIVLENSDVTAHYGNYVKFILRHLVANFYIHPYRATRVALLVYSIEVVIELNLNDYNNIRTLLDSVNRLDLSASVRGPYDLGAALQAAQTLYQSNARPDSTLSVVALTFHEPRTDVQQQLDDLHGIGAKVVVVSQHAAHFEQKNHVNLYTLYEMGDLIGYNTHTLVSKEICNDYSCERNQYRGEDGVCYRDYCAGRNTIVECGREAQCVNSPPYRQCQCPAGQVYLETSRRCVPECENGYYNEAYDTCIALPTLGTGCSLKAEVILVLDSSGSVGPNNFRLVKQFARDFAAQFELGSEQTRVALITYSNEARLLFGLDRFTNQAHLAEAIMAADYTAGATHTHAALNMAVEQFSENTTDSAQQILLVLTDGKSTYESQTIFSANALQRDNILTYVVGVGRRERLRMRELEAMATDPDWSHVFLTDKFDSLKLLFTRIARQSCQDGCGDGNSCYHCHDNQYLHDGMCYQDFCASSNRCRRGPGRGVQCRNTHGSYQCVCDDPSDVYDVMRGCVSTVPPPPINYMSCYASGDPHFNTFDRYMIHFMGICVYTLTEYCEVNGTLPHFSVDIKNQHRGNTRVSYAEYVEVTAYNVTIRLGLNRGIMVNGERITANNYQPNYHMTVSVNGRFAMVNVDFGLIVKFDGRHYVEVHVNEEYREHVCGLCGNADGDRRNDMMTKDGRQMPLHDYAAVGNSWIVPGKGTEDPRCIPEDITPNDDEIAHCDSSVEAQARSEAQCGLIASRQGPFVACHRRVDPQAAVENCVFDMCAEQIGEHPETLCRHLQTYADECREQGVSHLRWRSTDLCPLDCGANSHSSPEMSACPASCVRPDSETSCQDPPQEGCQCDDGFILSGTVCVPQEECGCLIDGVYLATGESMTTPDCSARYRCDTPLQHLVTEITCPTEHAQCAVQDGVRGCYCEEGHQLTERNTCEVPGQNTSIPNDPVDETPTIPGCGDDQVYDEHERLCVTLPTLGTGCSAAMDLVLVLDSSGSVGPANFHKLLQFSALLTSQFQISPQTTRVAVITFSTRVNVEFDLNTYANKEHLQAAIMQINYAQGWTRTDLALRSALNILREQGRAEATKVVVVVTDGESTVQRATVAAATALHQANHKVFAVGVGCAPTQAMQLELHLIGSQPSTDYVTQLDSFEAVRAISTTLAARLCHDACTETGTSCFDCDTHEYLLNDVCYPDFCSRNPCVGSDSGAVICTNHATYFTCACRDESSAYGDAEGCAVPPVEPQDPDAPTCGIPEVPHEETSDTVPHTNPDGELECTPPAFYSEPHNLCLNTGDLGFGCNTEADIVILVDSSGSVTAHNFEKLRFFVSHFFPQFVVDNNRVRFALVQFSSSVMVEFGLNAHNTTESYLAAIERMRYLEGWTRTDLALRQAHTILSQAYAERQVPQVLLLVSDGPSTEPPYTMVETNMLHNLPQGVTVFAIGVGPAIDNNIFKSELRRAASDPDESHLHLVETFETLKGMSVVLAQQTCTAVCDSESCIECLPGFSMREGVCYPGGPVTNITCEDELGEEACQEFAQLGKCSDPLHYLDAVQYCQSTCALCDAQVPICPPGTIYRMETNECAEHCADSSTDCPSLAAEDWCTSRQDYMSERCPVTCNVCTHACSPGYAPDVEANACVDEDECQLGAFDCPEHSTCENSPEGSYTCVCNMGYQYDPVTGGCQEIRCADKSVDCTERSDWCYDVTPGRQLWMRAHCETTCQFCDLLNCGEGFMLSPEGNCTDINECEHPAYVSCGSNADCMNTVGSYTCVCQPGYYGDPMRGCQEHRCQDILGTVCQELLLVRPDACTESDDVRTYDCALTCGYCHFNTDEGCRPGYQHENNVCTDIDECSTHVHQCPDGANCVNTHGAYRCQCASNQMAYTRGEQWLCADELECVARGDPHYVTFDGLRIDYMGTCVYTLATTACQSSNDSSVLNGSDNMATAGSVPYFNVEQKNEHRYRNTRQSWTKYVLVHVYDQMVRLDQGGQAFVNGEVVTLPITPAEGLQVTSQGQQMRLVTDFGLKVKFNGRGLAKIQLPGNFAESVCGICGNADGNAENDMRTPQGDIVTSQAALGNSWIVPGRDPTCLPITDEPVTCHPHVRSRIESSEMCGRLTATDGAFASCLNVVTPHELFEDCVFDLCATGIVDESNDVICLVLETYADLCESHNVTVSWRTETLCPLNCPVASHYSRHMSGCPDSCVDHHFSARCPEPPQEGCACDEGWLLDGNQCVQAPHQCGCTHRGRYYSIGETWMNRDCSERFRCQDHDVIESQTIACDVTRGQCRVDMVIGRRDCYCLANMTASCAEPVSPVSETPSDPDFSGSSSEEETSSANDTSVEEPEHPAIPDGQEIEEPRPDPDDDSGYFSLTPEPIPAPRPRPIGMETCIIPDDAISSSSIVQGHEAPRARPRPCNYREIPGGWLPQVNDSQPWIQIDLGRPIAIHGIGTLGHYQRPCWLTQFEIHVTNSSQSDGAFTPLHNVTTGEPRVFIGNHDQNTWKRHCLHRYYGFPPVARYIRLVARGDLEQCVGLRVELYGFRAADDPHLLEALTDDAWTRNTTGCACYWDQTDMNCACCYDGGCQCPLSNRHQCVQCGYGSNCGTPEINWVHDQLDGWTKTGSGCSCTWDWTGQRTDCACCQRLGCQCGQHNKNQCVQCGSIDSCGTKEHMFGPNEYCVERRCGN